MTADTSTTPDDDDARHEVDPLWCFEAPHIGRRTIRWFARRLREQLAAAIQRDDALRTRTAIRVALAAEFGPTWRELSAWDVTFLAKWYTRAPQRYLLFATAPALHRTSPVGSYRIRWHRVLRDLAVAKWLTGVPVPYDDDTLSNDVELEREGNTPRPATASPDCGSVRLPDNVQATLQETAAVRRARWPRACAVCGNSFTPARCNSRRCASCITAGRRKRTRAPRSMDA